MTPPRPDIEFLAAVDAGWVEEGGHPAGRVRDALADPAARPVLDALAATRADLARLADPPVPPAVAARWSAALRAELAHRGGPGTARLPGNRPGVGPDGDLPAVATRPATPDTPPVETPTPVATTTTGPDRRRRSDARGPGGAHRPTGRRRTRWRPALIAAVALLSVLVVSVASRHGTGPPDRTLLVREAIASFGVHDAGAYADDAVRAACLRALAPPDTTPTAPLLGGRQVTFAGRPGVVLVLGTGRRGRLDVVVVDHGCTTVLAAGLLGG